MNKIMKEFDKDSNKNSFLITDNMLTRLLSERKKKKKKKSSRSLIALVIPRYFHWYLVFSSVLILFPHAAKKLFFSSFYMCSPFCLNIANTCVDCRPIFLSM